MKIILLLLFSYCFCFTSVHAQKNDTLDSLEVSLENMSWKELNSIGNNLTDNYEFDKAEIYLKKAVEVAEKENGKDSLYAVSCRNLGRVYYFQGMYQKTEPFYLEAKETQAKTLGKEHIGYATYCNDLAILYYIQGFYKQAEVLYIEAKEIRERILGTQNPHYAASCNNLAALYMVQGLYQKAEPLYMESKEIKEKVFGKESLEYAISCNNLAALYFNRDLYKKAESLFLETKEIRGNILGKEHPEYAASCNNLAVIYMQQGLYREAEPFYIEAKEIRERVLGKEHVQYADVCDGLASLYSSIHLYLKAEPLYFEAKEIREKILGKQHPDYALSCISIGEFYYNQDLYKKAKPFYQEATQNKKEQIKLLFPIFSESEKQEYFASISYFFSNSAYFSTAYYNKYYPREREISQDIFNQQLFLKGIIFSSTQKMKEQILNSKDSVLINQYENWKKQKEEYISLIQTPASERDSSINMTEIAFQVNELEREISKKSESFSENINQKEYNWLDVKKGLSKNEATVEIIRLEKFNIQEKPADTIYVALIITDQTKESPELLVLKNGAAMDKGDFNYYYNTTQFQLENKESYNQYWKPIQDKLDILSNGEKYSKIYFSPDGIYHQLNLNVLKNPKTNKYVLEEQTIQLIASSRELLETKEKQQQKIDFSKNTENYKVTLLGYPAYSLSAKTNEIDKEKENLNGLQRVIGQQKSISILEGTKIETNQIDSLLQKANISTTLLQNAAATEENIKALQNPTILHIATHGFFVSEIPTSKTETLQEIEDRNLFKNPFLRSGLLLAGCQNPQVGKEDGILSAEEVMNLNLEGTELVVLSACETGLGDIANNEGVYGLQRAFRKAGAKTIIMSLWKVDDIATQLLMTTFYKEFLNGKTKREAFKIAQLKLKEKYNEPYYWGAFMMVGE